MLSAVLLFVVLLRLRRLDAKRINIPQGHVTGQTTNENMPFVEDAAVVSMDSGECVWNVLTGSQNHTASTDESPSRRNANLLTRRKNQNEYSVVPSRELRPDVALDGHSVVDDVQVVPDYGLSEHQTRIVRRSYT